MSWRFVANSNRLGHIDVSSTEARNGQFGLVKNVGFLEIGILAEGESILLFSVLDELIGEISVRVVVQATLDNSFRHFRSRDAGCPADTDWRFFGNDPLIRPFH